MEVEEIETQACNNELKRGGGGGGSGGGGGGGADDGGNRLRGWHHSRIIRVPRASGGKDRHSKVWTSKGLRDRRVRLSVTTAIQFYDLQDRLGYDQPSKAVEWLIKAAADSISELPSLNSSSNSGEMEEVDGGESNLQQIQNQQISLSKSSSTSETSKGSGLSLAQSDVRVNRVKAARERARERAAKEKEIGHSHNVNPNPNSQNSSFTELLTGSVHQPAMDIFGTNNSVGFSPFNVMGDNQHDLQHFSFVPDNFIPVWQPGGGDYNLNFTISSGHAGFNRGTLQSNSNLPFFIGSTPPLENHHTHQLCYGDGSRHPDIKGKGKN